MYGTTPRNQCHPIKVPGPYPVVLSLLPPANTVHMRRTHMQLESNHSRSWS